MSYLSVLNKIQTRTTKNLQTLGIIVGIRGNPINLMLFFQ